ncbi:MAG: thiamine ABC transporter substrate-binding protein [Candidatus Heimdallarchaeota archaeon]|nr:thiamine ABC transporter substrate-binding protein [Candidatus Heimdallarchaeota archaeon]MDH5644697.1 thiamine ABC transporter substrate-binding protein [Candidatus Heimdallarchaeota archaeon]
MENRFLLSCLTLMLVLAMIPSISIGVEGSTAQLTIYTYDSLLADPGYQFDRQFETYQGLPYGSVEVVLFEDAASIIIQASAEKSNPIADVLIGIDNILIEKARNQDILQPYVSTQLNYLEDGLVQELASDNLLTPYDYGIISLWYLNDRLPSINPGSFVLEDLLTEELSNQIIIQNPLLSSPGLGFFLWTIGIYGDPEIDLDGVIDGNWREFWDMAAENFHLTSSWGEAFELLYTEESGKSIMVSYTTSPAYGACLYDDYSTSALLSNEQGNTWGWKQIEGLGLVKNSDNQDLAKEFIDWFVSEEVQNEIYMNQWMYPSRSNIQQPSCYSDVIQPNTIYPLNTRITTDILESNLDNWLSEWEIVWVEGYDPAFLNFNYLLFFSVLLILPIIRRNIKKVI